jgi:predicted adenylyl cyclase CyaB
MIEVEAKVAVLDADAARKKISRFGKLAGKVRKIDDYYTLEETGGYPSRSLRVRHKGKYFEVNFKRRLSYTGGIHAKKEIEFSTSDIDNFIKLIENFGFRKWIRKEKECEIYRIKKNFQIELNKVRGLGWFIEIERLTDENGIARARKEVSKILGELGFSESDCIKEGYTKQLWNKRRK